MMTGRENMEDNGWKIDQEKEEEEELKMTKWVAPESEVNTEL